MKFISIHVSLAKQVVDYTDHFTSQHRSCKYGFSKSLFHLNTLSISLKQLANLKAKFIASENKDIAKAYLEANCQVLNTLSKTDLGAQFIKGLAQYLFCDDYYKQITTKINRMTKLKVLDKTGAKAPFPLSELEKAYELAHYLKQELRKANLVLNNTGQQQGLPYNHVETHLQCIELPDHKMHEETTSSYNIVSPS